MCSLVNAASRKPALAFRSNPCALIEQQAAGFETQLHIDDLAGHMLESSDRLTVLFAFVRISHRRFQHAPHRADGIRQDAAALPCHRAGKEKTSAALLADAIGSRHLAVVEKHLATWATCGGPFSRALYQSRGRARPWARETPSRRRALSLCRQSHTRRTDRPQARSSRMSCCRSECTCRRPARRRRQAESVRTGIRLAHCIGANQRAATQVREILRFCSSAPGRDERHHHGP